MDGKIEQDIYWTELTQLRAQVAGCY